LYKSYSALQCTNVQNYSEHYPRFKIKIYNLHSSGTKWLIFKQKIWLLNQSIKKINHSADNFQVKLRQLWCGNSSPITNFCGLVAVTINHCVNLWLTWVHMGLKSVTTVPTLSLCVRSGSSDVHVHVTDGMPHSCNQMLCTVCLLLLMPKN